MWVLFYHFHRVNACRKIFLDYTNLFSPNDFKKNEKLINILKTNVASLHFRLKENRWNKKYILKEINDNYLMIEK